MKSLWLSLCGVLILCGPQCSIARAQQPSSGVLTLQTTSRLVFLDVTVLDKKGHPVVKGLTKDDFTITEEKRPQRIFSYEPPELHLAASTTGSSGDKVPSTIFVVDLLNSRFSDFAYIRYSVRKYLAAQPALLDSPSELMVLGNQSLEVLQTYTRNRAELLSALDHLPTALPYKMMNGSFFPERFAQSLDALQQIALQSKGVPGRKNIVWIGHGGPSIETQFLPPGNVDELNRYVHDTTNLLVNARLSLFVIYPGLNVNSVGTGYSALSADADLGETDPFAGDINFGVLVNATGGKLFYGRNDVDAEIKTSQQYGSNYYTLTYQPPDGDLDGRFLRIRVTLKDPSLHAVTKAGYYAPDKNSPVDPRKQALANIGEAARSTIPFDSIDMTVEHIERHPDTNTAEVSILVKPRNISWQSEDNGRSVASFLVLAVSRNRDQDILSSKLEALAATAPTQDPARLAKETSRISISLRVPRRTKDLRVVVETSATGRMGAIEIDRKTLDAAPQSPTPAPQLLPRTQPPAPPATP